MKTRRFWIAALAAWTLLCLTASVGLATWGLVLAARARGDWFVLVWAPLLWVLLGGAAVSLARCVAPRGAVRSAAGRSRPE